MIFLFHASISSLIPQEPWKKINIKFQNHFEFKNSNFDYALSVWGAFSGRKTQSVSLGRPREQAKYNIQWSKNVQNTIFHFLKHLLYYLQFFFCNFTNETFVSHK